MAELFWFLLVQKQQFDKSLCRRWGGQDVFSATLRWKQFIWTLPQLPWFAQKLWWKYNTKDPDQIRPLHGHKVRNSGGWRVTTVTNWNDVCFESCGAENGCGTRIALFNSGGVWRNAHSISLSGISVILADGAADSSIVIYVILVGPIFEVPVKWRCRNELNLSS